MARNGAAPPVCMFLLRQGLSPSASPQARTVACILSYSLFAALCDAEKVISPGVRMVCGNAPY